jgi:transcriptional regulator with XRE-family HTH domain
VTFTGFPSLWQNILATLKSSSCGGLKQMKYLNLAWAIREQGSQFRFALSLGESESWLSRRLTGRVEFTPEERERVAHALGYPTHWLFQKPEPPMRNTSTELIHAHA